MTGDNGLRIAEPDQKIRERLGGLSKEWIGMGVFYISSWCVIPAAFSFLFSTNDKVFHPQMPDIIYGTKSRLF